ncbi:MAG: Imm1 family immunity protein [Pseudonocardiaceae bacterium]
MKLLLDEDVPVQLVEPLRRLLREHQVDAELPLATVLAAAEEYIRTGRRPTCINWMPATA